MTLSDVSVNLLCRNTAVERGGYVSIPACGPRTRDGKPLALLTETSPAKLEDELRALRRARGIRGRIHAYARGRARLGKMATEESDAEIRATRKTVKTKHAAGA